MKTIALIVAAGQGERLGGPIPKPYLTVGGMSVLRRSILPFMQHKDIGGVQVVIHKDHRHYYEKATDGLEIMPPVVGGVTRQESVRLGLEAIRKYEPSYVLIHDAARPLVSQAVIEGVLQGLKEHAAVLPALPVNDSLKRIENGQIEPIDRAHAYIAQTPQGFRFASILQAHERFEGEALTDDTALAGKAGIAIQLVPGDAENIKITTMDDVTHMQHILESSFETRVGQGFDVHKLQPFAAGTPPAEQVMTLCGVKVPHDHYLEGHSDADVGLHAITDALLGAMGAQDIGFHFSPQDARWKGADSIRFLQHASSLLAQRGGRVVHLDVTLICERPKIASHREMMIAHVAATLGLPPSRISVKATTTETLGFTGRGEGIAAQAVVTIMMPRETV